MQCRELRVSLSSTTSGSSPVSYSALSNGGDALMAARIRM